MGDKLRSRRNGGVKNSHPGTPRRGTREPAALSLNDLFTVADLPWPEQAEVVFGQEGP